MGVAGEDPRHSSVAFGEELIEATLALIGEKLDELGVQPICGVLIEIRLPGLFGALQSTYHIVDTLARRRSELGI